MKPELVLPRVACLGMAALGLACMLTGAGALSENTSVATEFEARYAAWVQARTEATARRLSAVFPYEQYYGSDEFQAIVDLGLPALPYIVAKLPEDRHVGRAFREIMKVEYHVVREGSGPGDWRWHYEEFPDLIGESRPPDYRTISLRWWTEGRQRATEMLEGFHTTHQQAVTAGDQAKAAKALERIGDLGIAVLPAMMTNIADGATDLVPVASMLTDGGIAADADAESAAAWWTANKEHWTLPEK